MQSVTRLIAIAGVVFALAAEPPDAVPPPARGPLPPGPAVDVAEAAVRDEELGRWLFGGEYLLVRPRRGGQDYAIVGGNPNWGPVGDIKSIEGGFDSGFRVGLGYRFAGEGWELGAWYTNYHVGGNDGVAGTVFPTLTHPALVTQVAEARASSSVNVNLVDVEFGRRAQVSEAVGLRLFVGARYANVDQTFQAAYSGGDVGRDEVWRRLSFDGGGARAGGEVGLRLTEGMGVYARGSTSLLAGQVRAGLAEFGNGVRVVDVTQRADRLIPVLDLGLGVSYQQERLRLAVGYDFQAWLNMAEAFTFVDDAHPAKFAVQSGTLGFDGVVFRAEWAY